MNLLMKFEISPIFVLRTADLADIGMCHDVMALNMPLNVLLGFKTLLTDPTEKSLLSVKYTRLQDHRRNV